MTERVLLYAAFERFWHWTQAGLIILLALTGLDIHYSWGLFGFEDSYVYHRYLAWGLIGLTAFAWFWHFVTGEWRQYVPDVGKGRTRAMMKFYAFEIFRGLPHPGHKTRNAKLNPLQRLAYLGLEIVLMPLITASGVLYFFYNEWQGHGPAWLSLETVAVVHLLVAFGIVAFVFGHVYLTTTGETLTSNIKAMITGYEELEGQEGEGADGHAS